MNSYISLSIKKEPAGRFKEFAKKYNCSYSDLLDHMIEFFIGHQLSPLADFDESLSAREEKLLKRINHLISIIRNIEKTQTLPTLAILEALMVQEQPKLPVRSSNPIRIENSDQTGNDHSKSNKDHHTPPSSNPVTEKDEPPISPQTPINHNPEEIDPFIKEELKNLLRYLISRVKTKKQMFGKNELILDISREEFRRIEIKIKTSPDVH